MKFKTTYRFIFSMVLWNRQFKTDKDQLRVKNWRNILDPSTLTSLSQKQIPSVDMPAELFTPTNWYSISLLLVRTRLVKITAGV